MAKKKAGPETVKCACGATKQKANFSLMKGVAKKEAIKKFAATLTAACRTCKEKAEKKAQATAKK